MLIRCEARGLTGHRPCRVGFGVVTAWWRRDGSHVDAATHRRRDSGRRARGDLAGQHSGFLMVPDRGFVLVMLTNSEGGPEPLTEFFAGDSALRRYAGVSNLPAVLETLTPAELAPYEGRYLYLYSNFDGRSTSTRADFVRGADGEVAWLRTGGRLVRHALTQPGRRSSGTTTP